VIKKNDPPSPPLVTTPGSGKGRALTGITWNGYQGPAAVGDCSIYTNPPVGLAFDAFTDIDTISPKRVAIAVSGVGGYIIWAVAVDPVNQDLSVNIRTSVPLSDKILLYLIRLARASIRKFCQENYDSVVCLHS
jgi:hypothetical protein